MAALFRACLRDGAPQKGAEKRSGMGGKCGILKIVGDIGGCPPPRDDAALKRTGVAIRTAVEWGGGPKKGQGNTTPAGRWPHPYSSGVGPPSPGVFTHFAPRCWLQQPLPDRVGLPQPTQVWQGMTFTLEGWEMSYPPHPTPSSTTGRRIPKAPPLTNL